MDLLAVPGWVGTTLVVLEYLIKLVALGLVPENRRPSSSQAWLLLILLLPVVGLPLFLLIGSPYVRGRRHRLQQQANRVLERRTAEVPALSSAIAPRSGLVTLVELNRNLTALPLTHGTDEGLHFHYEESIAAMAAAVDGARERVHVEIYIVAWDETTDVFFQALARAVRRGVTVRLLMDHLGSRGYPGWRRLGRRLTDIGVEWQLMLPLRPWRGQVRRPDLRNHRKLVVVDDRLAFMGSQNMIDASYLKRRHRRVGRLWRDCNIELTGPVVDQLNAVFALDWYTETGELLELPRRPPSAELPEGACPMQVIPSGPGYTTEPNLRLFTSLVHGAQERLTVVSPYFVPDEALELAITTAAMRGVQVELFVSERADQFMVHHAQRSYYHELLQAGVRIWALPRPYVLHSKFMTVDDSAAVFGSSNMDMRSFYLDYEVTLLGFGAGFVADLQQLAQHYRELSSEITPELWSRRSPASRYLDNVMRLTSALQ